jgi:hypothetical protein
MADIYEGNVEEELSKNGSFASITKGVSMRPLFRTRRDMIVIKPIERPLRKYDVVLYRGPAGEYILHRIIKIKENVYVIRGDNTYRKEYVPKDRVIGVLDSFNRKGKSKNVRGMGFWIYSRFWNFIYPLRFCCVRLRAAISKVYRKLFKRK